MRTVLVEPLTISSARLNELSAPLRENGHSFEAYYTKPKTEEEWLSRIGDAEQVILANTPMPESVIERVPKLKYINIAFTGMDHVPVAKAEAKGIRVVNAAGYSDEGVAELVIGMTISLLRKLKAADEGIRQGGKAADFCGAEIAGRTVGIIGTGRIGTRVAKLFHAFGVQLIGFNRSEKDELKALGLTYLPLEEVLCRADILTVHLPSTPETRNFLTAREFALMKPTAILLNCARGPIVHSGDLADALQRGALAGAGVDVFNEEPPLSAEEPLLSAPNVLLTPHIAYFTNEAMVKRAEIVFRHAAAFLAEEV
ncbi:NAD(P)-dependent oxidoreductase [Murdochiella massiliensis]|uniref:NAD(P)-dependent oxidoreductase n=1 Tax=Murdochiella massiliensis TaxID=1673723 RepID=UPI000835C9E2|nr:NAD(P)-dependent oxidoreductase [Murdochiella massiliensis]